MLAFDLGFKAVAACQEIISSARFEIVEIDLEAHGHQVSGNFHLESHRAEAKLLLKGAANGACKSRPPLCTQPCVNSDGRRQEGVKPVLFGRAWRPWAPASRH